MHAGKWIFCFLLLLMFITACGIKLPVTGGATPTPTQEAVMTTEVTVIVRERTIVKVEVTQIVKETVIVPVEITRVVTEPVVVTPTQIPSPTASSVISQGFWLQIPRARHASVDLGNGKVLLIGGSRAQNEQIGEVENFDPTNGMTNLVFPLSIPRHDHTATLLEDGRVLVVGGYSLPWGWLNDAEVYDPSFNTWTTIPPLYSHSVQHTATRLDDGRVLVVGGCIASGVCTDRAEIFNPEENTWREAALLESDRASHTAVLLEDGRVLIIGGYGANGVPAGGDAMLYDPRFNRWAATGPMITPRTLCQAVRLLDGRVLVSGGVSWAEQDAQRSTAAVEIYDPATNVWRPAADMAQPRQAHNLALLPSGDILAIGGVRDPSIGWIETSAVSLVERYNPVTDQWRSLGNLPRPVAYGTVHLLPDSRVWLAGGQFTDIDFSNTSWFIDPR